jgi:hypothetical protein
MGYNMLSNQPRSRQRQRAEQAAIRLLDAAVRWPAQQRGAALQRIRRAKRPTVEARRIIAAHQRHEARRVVGDHDTIGYADVQELRVRFIRRDGGIWDPQASLLRDMDKRITSGGMTVEEFEGSAAAVWTMPQVLPEGAREAAQK